MHSSVFRIVPGLLSALWHVLILALRPFRGKTPATEDRRRAISARVGRAATASLIVLAAITSQASAQGWRDPSISVQFNADGRCVAGTYSNATYTHVTIDWTAFNTDTEPGRSINLAFWNEGAGGSGALGSAANAPTGQLTLQTTSVAVQPEWLIGGTTFYVSLIDYWQSESAIWGRNTSPVLAPDRVAPADGAAGYVAVDMTTDPDCVPPPSITGTISPVPGSSPDAVPLVNNATIDIGEVEVLDFAYAYVTAVNGGSARLLVYGGQPVSATNSIHQSIPSSGSSETGYQLVPTLRPREAGPFSGVFEINSNDPALPTLTFTVTGTAVDTVAPGVHSIQRVSPTSEQTSADSVRWRVRYSESVTGVDAADFVLTGTTAHLTVSGSGSIYDVTASGGDLSGLNGTITLQHAPTFSIVDPGGNALVNTTPTVTNQNTYQISNTQPGFSASFAPSAIETLETSTLTLSINNTAGTEAATSLDVTSNLPAGLQIASPSNASTTCTGGTITAVSGSGTFSYSGGTVTAGGVCAVSVDIVARSGGNFSYVTGNLTSSQGNSGTASASLSVTAVPPTVTIGALSGPTGGTYSATITLSKVSTDFTVGDLTLTNATATLTGSGTSYTVILTPLADGPIALSVDASRFTDAAGTANTASNSVSATYDGTAPTVTLAALTGPVAGVYTTTATFSEDVAGLDASDLTLVNASATVTGSGAVYTITLTPAGDGTLSVQIPADVAEDAASNGNTASNEVTATYDGTAPTVTLAALTGPVAGVYTTTATFSEDVTGLDASDLTLVNASATVTGSGAVYTITLTPAGDGALSAQIPADVAVDAATNGNTASNEVTATYDGTAPTVTLAALTGPVAGVYTTTATFSEHVTGLDASDLTLVNASATVTGSGAVYTITLTPAGDGTLSVQIPADVAEDAASNGNTASNEVTATYDGTAPTVTLSALSGPSSGVYTTTATFSEAVTGFDAADLTLVNASATVTGSGAVYTITLTPAGDGALSVQIPADVAEDAATNGNTASNSVSATYDGTAPTVTLAALTGPVAGVYTTTATFSEDVTGLDASDLTLVNASATLTGSGAVYTITLTPSGDGAISVQIPADVAEDAATNGNTASNSVSATYDGTAPTVTLAALTGPVAGIYTTTATFSEAVTGLDAADLTLVNASATLSGSGAVYTITVTPLGDGTLSVQIPADVAQDAAINGNTASNSVSATYDGTAPTVTLAALTGPVAGVYTTTATFSEAVTGLDAADLTLVNASATLTGSGAVYTITLTPSGDGAISVQIPADVAEDAATNGNTASNSVSATYDGTAPTVTLAALTGPVAGIYTTTATFSEHVTGLDASDLTLVNASATVTGSGAVYTITLTPSGDGAISVQIPADVAEDAATNGNTASNSVSATYDGTAPTVTLAALTGPVAGIYTTTATFSEDVTGLDASDLTLVNASATLSGSGAVYTITVTPLGDGTLSVQIPADVAEDAAINGNTASNSVSATYDGTAPTVTLAALTGPVAGVYTTTATFSEDVTGLDASDLTLVNASATLSGSGAVYTITLTPSGDGALSVQIPADVAEDAAINGNTASNSVSATYDGTAPTVTLAALTGPVAGVYTTTATFSEDVTGLDASDLTLVNASATLTGSGAVYTITLTPAGDGALSVQIPADVAEDAASNGNTASNEVTATYDGTAPTVTLAALTGPVAGVYTTTATFSEDVTGLDASDLTLVNASATVTGSGAVYTITLTPAGDGALSAQIPADVAVDAATNGNTASNEVTATYDGTAPTVTLAALTGPVAGVYTTTATFSEDVTGLDASDLTLVNASATLTGSGAVYTITLTPSGDGAISVQIPADVAEDAAGNENIASDAVEAIHDGTPPTVSLSEFTGPADGTFSAEITLSEPSDDFALGDLHLVNATGALSGAGTGYRLVVTPIADGLVSAQVVAGSFTDTAGNANAEPSNLVSVTYDGTAPTVTIAEAPEAFSGAASLSVTILFSEAVSGFEPEGVLARNARVVDLSGAGDRYMATIRADGAGDVTLQIAAGAARDAAGNDSLASEAVHIENRTIAETQGQIARFMLHRADQLVSNQPGLICLMQGSCGGGALSVNTNEDGLRFSVSTMSSALTAGWPLWMQVQGARSDDPDGDTEYLIGTIGAHQEISDRLYLGVMLQFDHVARNDGIGRIEGSGWLAGPYVVGRLADHPLYFEGRLLWGQTRNTITPFGTYSDRFDTERMLAMARISGEMVFGDVTLMPTVAASHTTDRQQTYTDSLGNVIGAQDIALTRLEVGFDARWPVTLGLSEWILEGGIRALHTRSSGSGLTLADSAPVDGTRGRINLGIRHVTRSGGEVSMSGYYDGIGQADYEGYGLEIGYHHDF